MKIRVFIPYGLFFRPKTRLARFNNVRARRSKWGWMNRK
jgi:hypothetical protein